MLIEHDPSLLIGDRLVRSSTDFSPERVCTPRDADVAELCSVLVGTRMFPVGVDSFHMTIYLAGDETFYAGLDASVFEYASSFGELLEHMAFGVRPKRLADWA